MDGIIGEIRPFSINYVPQGWLACNGALYPVQQYAALYTIIANNFGGTGNVNFNVPNLSGKTLTGAQSGVASHTIWSSGGTETVTLNPTQLPSHNHAINIVARTSAAQSAAGLSKPGPTTYLTNAFSITANKGIIAYAAAPNMPVVMNASMILGSGGGLPHSNMAPYLALNYCICYDGTYPLRP